MVKYTIGLDYGSNSVRAVVVNIDNSNEVGQSVWGYSHGQCGIVLSRNPHVARQHPADYCETSTGLSR